MAAKEHRLGAKGISLGASSLHSQTARGVAQLGVLSYWCGLVLAAFSLIVASAFAALTAEPLAHRLLSVVILGIFPGLAAWATGWVLLWILTSASVVCDRVVMLLQPKYQVLVATTSRIGIFVARRGHGTVARFVRAIRVAPPACHYGLERIIATATFYTARTVRGLIVAYRCWLIAVTFPVRLVARIDCDNSPADYRGPSWWCAIATCWFAHLHTNPVLNIASASMNFHVALTLA